MSNETKEQILHRLREKHAEGLLLRELENGFEMSPEQSALVFETAKKSGRHCHRRCRTQTIEQRVYSSMRQRVTEFVSGSTLSGGANYLPERYLTIQLGFLMI